MSSLFFLLIVICISLYFFVILFPSVSVCCLLFVWVLSDLFYPSVGPSPSKLCLSWQFVVGFFPFTHGVCLFHEFVLPSSFCHSHFGVVFCTFSSFLFCMWFAFLFGMALVFFIWSVGTLLFPQTGI